MRIQDWAVIALSLFGGFYTAAVTGWNLWAGTLVLAYIASAYGACYVIVPAFTMAWYERLTKARIEGTARIWLVAGISAAIPVLFAVLLGLNDALRVESGPVGVWSALLALVPFTLVLAWAARKCAHYTLARRDRYTRHSPDTAEFWMAEITGEVEQIGGRHREA